MPAATHIGFELHPAQQAFHATAALRLLYGYVRDGEIVVTGRWCKRCQSLKAEFYAGRTECKDCSKAATAESYARRREAILARHKTPEFRAKAAADRRERRASDPEFHERIKAHNRNSRARNLEASKATARRYREANWERVKAANRAWRDKQRDHYNAYGRARYHGNPAVKEQRAEYRRQNPHVKAAQSARRRALKQAAPGTATLAQVQARIAYYGGRCWMCPKPWDSLDHVKPLAAGGSNWPANLRPACRACNSTKNAKWPWPLVGSC